MSRESARWRSPGNANGQKIYLNGRLVGSKIIGQAFETQQTKNGKPETTKTGGPVLVPDRKYFQTRPSGTGEPYVSGGTPDNAAGTTFSNLGPNSAATEQQLAANLRAYLSLEKPYDLGLTAASVPVDAVNSSASGIDPDISVANADIQAHRVAAVRHLSLARVGALISKYTHGRGLGFSGEAGVNVLELNLALDRTSGTALMAVGTKPGRPRGLDVHSERRAISLFQRDIVRRAAIDSFLKLDPRVQIRNPVMLVVEVGAVITTVTWLIQVFGGGPLGGGREPAWYTLTISIWLWLTVVFANLAEAFAEGRGRAQADTLRALRQETVAKLQDGSTKKASELVKGDVVVVEAGELIPGDGTVIEGIASVDESAITGESAPVIRESGGDRSAVTGGTRVLSDRIVVEITQEPGKSFLDRMIALVEGAARRKTPNEIALNILLAGLTLIFLIVVATLRPFGLFASTPISETTLISLLVALIPTTIGALLSAIGIAGMDRLVRRNVLALSGRAVEASGDVDVLLLDKTGTITIGNRLASEFIPMPGVSETELAEVAQLSSLADETPEGRSIVVLAKQYGLREHDMTQLHAEFVPFSAQTRMSGVNLDGRQLRKGAGDAVISFIQMEGGRAPTELQPVLDRIGRDGGDPAGRSKRLSDPRRGLPQGHDQGGHAPALRSFARDGHPDDHDHGRQPPHRGKDRLRIRRR